MANIENDITFRTLPDGSREIAHPSGVKVIETLKQRQAMRAGIVAMIAEQTKQLADLDAEEVKIIADVEKM